jgi:hypothetical protein
MTLRQRLDHARRSDDRGAALVIALIFVTVVVVVMAAVLAYADANIRATVALRRQASTAAAAEAAAEIAINALRKGNYNGTSGDCFGTLGNTMTLPNLHPAAGGASDSAVVTCERDTGTSQVPSTGTPTGYALRALQEDSALETAIDVKVTGSGSGINVAGDVGSRSNIVMDHGALNVTGSVYAKSCTGTINATVTTECGPTARNVPHPLYAEPPDPTISRNVPGCATKMTFEPGIYSNLSALNDAWSTCGTTAVYDFRPGVYYFTFNGAWRINRGTMVAGSRNALTTTPPGIPGACPNPLDTTKDPLAGVQFVFGTEAQMLLTGSAKVEICARAATAASPVPIALYGLTGDIGSGALRVRGQSGCIVRVTGNLNNRCAVVKTDNHSGSLVVHFQGHVYQPGAKVELDLRGSSDQFFSGGMTVRAVQIFSPASSTLPTPISSGPIQTPGPGRTVIFLTVYVCTEQSTCATGSGRVRLRVKVGLADPSGTTTPGARGVTIYSWSVQR